MKSLLFSCTLLFLLIIQSCAMAPSPKDEYGLQRTAAAIGCSEKNTKIDESTWKHNVGGGIITYKAICNDKAFYCTRTAPFNFDCKKAYD